MKKPKQNLSWKNREVKPKFGLNEFLMAGGVVLILLLVLAFAVRPEKDEAAEAGRMEAERVEDNIRAGVRGWMSRSLADPEAELMDYSHELDEHGSYTVHVQVRGRNALGGYVFGRYQMTVNAEGGVVFAWPLD
jgi:hypothetical protein